MQHTPSPPVTRKPAPETLQRLSRVVGPAHALFDPAAQQPYLHEWRDRYVGRAAAVLRPANTAEVSEILKIASETRLAIVPQGGNTGLVGGQIPFETGDEVVLSLTRLKTVRALDPAGTWMIAEAGVTLAEAQSAAERAGRALPLSLPSEGTSQIGGVLSTNAGGLAVLAYGSARQFVLGLEVVLADGRVWDGLRTLKKDNTGYDLKDLFVGAEGTLGIITAAALRLHPSPRERATAFVSLADPARLTALYRLIEDAAGPGLTAFEFLSAEAMACVTRHVAGARDPMAAPAPWYALIELTSLVADGAVADRLERSLGEASARGLILDAVVAASLTQAKTFWRLREELSDAQKHEGGSIKHDISVSVGDIPAFLARADGAVQRISPGARPMPFGHYGDGNVHYNVSQPPGMDKTAFLALWEPMQDAVHAIVADMGGSISAEHGIGRMKRGELRRTKSSVELELMTRLKAAFDPVGILNPGKLL